MDQLPTAQILDGLRGYIESIVDARLKSAGTVKTDLDPRGIRLARGIELAELAISSGVAESTISRLERGLIRRPSPRVLNQLAAALGVSAAEYRSAVASLIQRGAAA